MTQQLTSRERMLEAISCRKPDYAPCCFMIFSALRSQCKDEFEFVDRQLELGLDVAIGIQSGLLSGRGHTDQADLGACPRGMTRGWPSESGARIRLASAIPCFTASMPPPQARCTRWYPRRKTMCRVIACPFSMIT